MDTPTLASLLTPQGIITAGLIVTTVVALIKGVFPFLDARVSGALMAFIVSLILYVFVGLATNVTTLDAGFVVFTAWLAVASSAIGIKAGLDHASAQSAKADPITDVIDPDVPLEPDPDLGDPFDDGIPVPAPDPEPAKPGG